MEQITNYTTIYLNRLHMPSIRWTDIVEIIVISFLIYQIILWIKNTRAWALLKGILTILAFILIAAVFNMTTILWIAKNILSLVVIATVVVLNCAGRWSSLAERIFLLPLFLLTVQREGTDDFQIKRCRN